MKKLSINKKKFHPNYTDITIKLVNNHSFKTRSTFQEDILSLDIDTSSHQAWTKKSFQIDKINSKIKNFNNKYRSFF